MASAGRTRVKFSIIQFEDSMGFILFLIVLFGGTFWGYSRLFRGDSTNDIELIVACGVPTVVILWMVYSAHYADYGTNWNVYFFALLISTAVCLPLLYHLIFKKESIVREYWVATTVFLVIMNPVTIHLVTFEVVHKVLEIKINDQDPWIH